MALKNKIIKRNDKTSSRAPNLKSEDGDSAREKIKEIAIELFAFKGLDGTSTREISKKSGLNISLISYYFGGKEGLYKAIIREHLLSIKEKADSLMFKLTIDNMTADSFSKEIGHVIDIILHNNKDNKYIMMMMMRERLAGFPFARDAHEEIVGPTAENLVNLIRVAQEKNIVKPSINPSTFVLLLVESIWGYTSALECNMSIHKQAHKVKKNTAEFKNIVIEIFLKGILK